MTKQEHMGGLKRVLFRLSAWQIGVLLAAIIITLVFLAFKVFAFISNLNWQLYSVYILLVFILAVSRITRFVGVGLRFSFFVLFCMVITLGPIVTIILRMLSTPVRLWLLFANVPLKSVFRSKEEKIMMQTVISTISILFIALSVQMITLSNVLGDLAYYYMLLYIIWTAALYAIRFVFPKGPRFRSLAASAVAVAFNWWLVTAFGQSFIGFLLSAM